MRGNLHEKNVMFTILMRKIENKKKQERREKQMRVNTTTTKKMRQQMKLNNFATVYIGEWVPQRQRRQQSHEHTTYIHMYIFCGRHHHHQQRVRLHRHCYYPTSSSCRHFPLTIARAVILLFRPLLNPNSPFIFLAVKYCSCIFKISIRFILHNQVQLQQFSLS